MFVWPFICLLTEPFLVSNKCLTKNRLSPQLDSSVFSWILLSLLETFINFSVQICPLFPEHKPLLYNSYKNCLPGNSWGEEIYSPFQSHLRGQERYAIILSIFHLDNLGQELMESFSAPPVVGLPPQITGGLCYGATALRLHAKGPPPSVREPKQEQRRLFGVL